MEVTLVRIEKAVLRTFKYVADFTEIAGEWFAFCIRVCIMTTFVYSVWAIVSWFANIRVPDLGLIGSSARSEDMFRNERTISESVSGLVHWLVLFIDDHLLASMAFAALLAFYVVRKNRILAEEQVILEEMNERQREFLLASNQQYRYMPSGRDRFQRDRENYLEELREQGYIDVGQTIGDQLRDIGLRIIYKVGLLKSPT